MESVSIHPRVKANTAKVNTSKPHKGKGKLAKKQAHLNRRRVAREATVNSMRNFKGNVQGAFKVPGSMKGRS
jgi:hypothetical protein